jgi:hypothetical protein
MQWIPPLLVESLRLPFSGQVGKHSRPGQAVATCCFNLLFHPVFVLESGKVALCLLVSQHDKQQLCTAHEFLVHPWLHAAHRTWARSLVWTLQLHIIVQLHVTRGSVTSLQLLTLLDQSPQLLGEGSG